MTEQSDTAMAEQAREDAAMSESSYVYCIECVEVDVAAIRARADKATPGPWTAYSDRVPGEPVFWAIDECNLDYEYSRHDNQRGDAEFIASARTDIPLLCDALEAAHRRIERLESEARDWQRAWLQETMWRLELQSNVKRDAEETE
jgi:hypothetical protein